MTQQKSESANQNGLNGTATQAKTSEQLAHERRDHGPVLHPVVLTGGSGTRLWPISRNAVPKQLLPLTSQKTMLQDTLLRLRGIEDLAAPVMVCNQEHRFMVAEQLKEIGVKPSALMLEPTGRNTAPAVAVAALQLVAHSPDALMLVMPADHVIANVPAFHVAVAQAKRVAQRGYLVTFGVVPSSPETGYGYIERGEPLMRPDGGEYAAGVASVTRFVEKPDLDTAQKYVEAGNYFWNSGMFLFYAEDYLRELERFEPLIFKAAKRSMDAAYQDLGFCRLGEEAFKQCPSESIDVAVMEKTEKAVMVPVDIGWNDVGSWSALWDFQPKDERGNVARGEVILHDVGNSYVHAEKRLIAAVGVDDLIIVETADAVLVAHKDRAQDVKRIVERLQAEGRTEHEIHRKAYRPWGSYECVDRGERFQVKRLTVNPDATLSLQMHHHRSEHWIVVSGTAEVTLGKEVRLVAENESIYIPLGSYHRIHNPGRIPLHMIEVQSGPYLGEDDIVRFEDTYGRLEDGKPQR